MKILKYVMLSLVFLAPASSMAALKCNTRDCDVRWYVHDSKQVDYSSVCYNYKGKAEYKECRQLAVKAFKIRCDKASLGLDYQEQKAYCEDAVKKYVP